MIKVRKAVASDAELISHLCSELGYPSDIKTIANRLDLIAGNSGHCVYVAIVDDNVVGWIHGMITLHVESDPFVEIGGLVVSRTLRDRGIGRMLVDNVREWASANNIRSIRAGCQTKRIDAHKFYQDTGFTKMKVQTIFGLIIDD